MDKELPEGWKHVTLGQVCEKIVGGGTPSTKVAEYWNGTIPWISSADIHGLKDISLTRAITSQAIENSAANIVPKDSIIVVTRVGLGKIAIAPCDLAFSQDNQGLILKKSLIAQRYALLCLSQAVQLFKHQSRGTTISGVTKKQLSELTVPLPPLEVQHQIVEKIEELFSELDKGVESLRTAQQQLKVYRQAVLKWAFEGRLTNENVKDGELPEGWRVENMGNLIEQPKYGTSKKCDYSLVGKAVLRIPNIISGSVDITDLKYAEFDSSEISAYTLKEGDLLTIRSNGSVNIVGQCALITKRDEDFLFAGYLIRLRPKKNLMDSKYLLYALSSSDLRNQIEEKARSTSGVNNINTDELKALKINHCNTIEQQKIVQEIESRLSVCDKMEETIAASLQQAEALRQSILKRAFEGKLV